MAKVLLVEDDINLREIYAARLTAEGYQVAAASDGEEALAKAVKERPDLILLDIMMPRISGFDVLDIIRSTPQIKNTRVVILTALSQNNDRERGESLGVDRYLIKSQITLEDVVQTIQEVLASVSPVGGSGPKPKDKKPSDSMVQSAVDNLNDQTSKIVPKSTPFLADKSEAEVDQVAEDMTDGD